MPSPYLSKSSKTEDLLIRFNGFNSSDFSFFETWYLARPLFPMEIIKCVDIFIRWYNSFCVFKIGNSVLKGI